VLFVVSLFLVTVRSILDEELPKARTHFQTYTCDKGVRMDESRQLVYGIPGAAVSDSKGQPVVPIRAKFHLLLSGPTHIPRAKFLGSGEPGETVGENKQESCGVLLNEVHLGVLEILKPKGANWLTWHQHLRDSVDYPLGKLMKPTYVNPITEDGMKNSPIDGDGKTKSSMELNSFLSGQLVSCPLQTLEILYFSTVNCSFHCISVGFHRLVVVGIQRRVHHHYSSVSFMVPH
jgi:hypothetical protein